MMTENEKVERLISPEKFYPKDVRRGMMCGNDAFIKSTSEYLDILSESQFWPVEKLEEIQVLRFNNLSRNILARSSFWAENFKKYISKFSEISDMYKLPVFRRNTLLKFGEEVFVPPLKDDYPLFERTTSGTTGIPLKLLYSEREMLISFIPFHFRHPELERVQISNLLSRKPFVVLGMPGFRLVAEKDFFNKHFPSINSSDLENKKFREDIYKSIFDTTPAFLMGFASLVLQLAKWANVDQVSLPLLAVRTTSEPLSINDRRLLKEVFKVPVVDMLNSNGIGVIGFECPSNQGRFHVNAESVVVEVVDDDNNILPAGEVGEIVVTSLSHIITPIIRYAIGDTGRMIDENCPCGKTLPLFEFYGRRGHEVVLPSGQKIRAVLLHELLSSFGFSKGIKQFQVKQETVSLIKIFLVSRRPISEKGEINLRILLNKLFGGEKIIIEFEYVDKIPAAHGVKPSFFIPL